MKKKISRRYFMKSSIGVASGIAVLGSSATLLSSCNNRADLGKSIKVFIPMPIQVVIDDVGWWSGTDGSQWQEPYRTGISRNHVPADYQAIIELGKGLGIRPQAATILCEWDKENILRQLPASTWMGGKWDNSKWVGSWLEEAAEIIRNNRQHYELTLHGIGHEYWEGGIFTRAEWTDSNGQMRPRDQVEKHLDYFGKLMDQHNLGPFPESFVPTAFRHCFGPSEGREVSLAELLKKKGINYINSPINSMHHKERVQHGLFGFDAGVMTIDRGEDEFPWTAFPGEPGKELTGPTCGMHWPNMLHPDPERNMEVVQKWINYLKPYNEKPETMLAPDSVVFQHQLAHKMLTAVQIKGNSVELDFLETDNLPGRVGEGGLTMKIVSGEPLKFKATGVKIVSQFVQGNEQFFYTLKLEREPDRLKAQISLIV